MIRFSETLHRYWGQFFEVSRTLYSEQTEHQNLVIFDVPELGRVLALDGVVQVCEADEFTYHEMLAHVPLFAKGDARSVLVIGGGDGGLLREVLKHPLEHVVMVEIDRKVIDLCTQYMPSISAGAFDDPRVELVIADGVRFMAEEERRFDVIVVDSTDPIGPGECLFTEAFYADCARRLTPGGILVTQNGVPFVQPEEVRSTYGKMRTLFADAGFFATAVPTYFGGVMTLAWGTNEPEHRKQPLSTLAERFSAAGIETRYYTPDVHVASFALPRYIQSLMDDL